MNPNEGFQAQLREFERLGADPTRWYAPCQCLGTLHQSALQLTLHRFLRCTACAIVGERGFSVVYSWVSPPVPCAMVTLAQQLTAAANMIRQVETLGRAVGCPWRSSKHGIIEALGGLFAGPRRQLTKPATNVYDWTCQ